MNKRIFVLMSLILMSGFGMALSNPSSNWQANQPTFDSLYSGDFENYWPILGDMKNGQCNATTDFVIGIPPGGCSPSVVTSDLLAEQNVPVFCQLYAIKVNPLIKVSAIKSISFKGDYPEGVRSIVYHPARAAVKSYSTLLGEPTLENIGYVVIILKQEKVEANITEEIFGNLTATMTYDAEEAYGVGKGDYYLEPTSDDDWNRDYMASSFWNGRGYLRVLDVSDGTARIQVMRDKDTVLRTLNLKEGETSSSSYLPGFYCKAGLKVKLTDITTQEDMAQLNVDGQTIWVRKGSTFLDGKCSVRSLDVRGNSDGNIGISCSGTSGTKTLSLKGEVLSLREKDGADSKEYNVGDKFFGEYVVAYGEVGVEKKKFFVLSEFALDSDDYRFVGAGVELKDAKNNNTYFERSVDVVRDELVAYYGSEEKDIGGTWGAEALYEEIVLAGEIGKFVTQKALMDLFLDEYPLAETADYVRDMRARLDGTDYSESYFSVYVGDEFRSIAVVDFKAVGEGNKSVSLKVGPGSYSGLNEKGKNDFEHEKNGVKIDASRSVEVVTIYTDKVTVRFNNTDKKAKDDARSRSVTIKDGERVNFDGIEVYVEDIDVKQVAHVSLIPEVDNEKSEADFSFRIGVEKRAIELSPEKATELIGNLNESIEKWEGIIERMGDVVTGLKGACFATSAVLMIKNMASGISGEAAARSKVMAGYREICDTDSKYREMTRTECYNELSDEIDADVTSMAESLEGVNVYMKSCQEGNVENSGGIIGGTSVVKEKEYRECLAEKIGKGVIEIDVGGKKKNVSVSGDLSLSQLQAIMLWQNADGEVNEKAVKSEMDSALRYVALSQEDEGVKADIEKRFEVGGIKFPVSILKEGSGAVYNGGLKKTRGELESVVSGVDWGSVKNNEIVGAQVVHSGSSDYLYLFEADSGSQLGIYKVKVVGEKLEIEGKKLDKIPESKGIALNLVDAGSCSNAWRSKAQVQYFDIGDNAGLPAIVPFGYPGKSLDGGWYVWVSNSGSGVLSDSVQGYKASGDVSNFYICNIGTNGLMESKGGDDDCLSFNENSIPESKDFQLCKNVDMNDLYDRARQAIRQASGQAENDKVSILGESIDRGKPVNTPSVECQEFMSPSDCKIMFNVCDPVICPPSRCNFGGEWEVTDVIQTGVIGSLILCLPNAKEGIFLPICLSGVHAGLDSYLSILKSEKACLEHSLETGELVGICDQITSIYKCEFFWRQMAPLMDHLIPGVIEYAVNGGSVRGGGEYALVTSAWENTKNSISYFKDTYAQNAFKAFNIRSTQEVGSTVCKSFVGTSVPGSADFIDNLLAPESPSQFYAQFSEQLFTEATVPSTSHYKVYFHIYAGNDQGVQYKVYLKNPPASSYYASTPEISNADMSGYIAAGSSADRSVDFTAPSGYKELCVVINAQEECGFKQVTTDFGLDWVSKKYVEEQALENNIKTEKECISGSPSALSMAQLNVQAGAEEVLNPEIALRGIVRVCASSSPGVGGTNSSRWKDVGHCGESSLRCWLDVDSVKDDLEMIETFSGESISLLDEQRGLINNTRLGLEAVRALLSKARQDIEALTISRSIADGWNITYDLDEVIGTDSTTGAGTNGDRAEALSLKASVWRLLVGQIVEDDVEKVVEVRDVAVDESDIGNCKEYCFGEGFSSGVSVEEDKCAADYKDGCCCSEKIESDNGDVNSDTDVVQATISVPGIDKDCWDYFDLLKVEAAKYEEFDEFMLLALMQKESSCDWTAFSGSSYGLMQISSFEMCSDIGIKEEILEDVSKNIECGALILSKKYSERSKVYTCPAFEGIMSNGKRQKELAISKPYSGIEYALRGYNGWGCAGPTTWADHDYVEKVMGLYEVLKEAEVAGDLSDYDKVIKELDDAKTDFVLEEEIVAAEVLYSQYLDDTFYYRWNEEEGYVESKVYVGFFDGSDDLYCEWNKDCDIVSSYASDREIEMHDNIMSRNSWAEALELIGEYHDNDKYVWANDYNAEEAEILG